jgi:hypothetical protein
MADPISLGIAALGSTVLSSVFSKPSGPQMMPQAPPVVEPPKVMPVADDEATTAARRRELTKLSQSSGRASTFLSDTKLGSSGTEKLG